MRVEADQSRTAGAPGATIPLRGSITARSSVSRPWPRAYGPLDDIQRDVLAFLSGLAERKLILPADTPAA